jgi:predicted nucleic acid-binding protein
VERRRSAKVEKSTNGTVSVAAVVVDASILVDLLANDPRSASLGRLLDHGHDEFMIPALCDIEVASALRNAVIRRALSRGLAASLLNDYLDLPLERHGHESLLPRTIELAENFTAYDASYAALAERLGARLITSDMRLARAVRAHTEVALVE